MASPQLQMIRDILAARPVGPDASRAEIRKLYDEAMSAFPAADGVAIEACEIAGIPAEASRTPEAARDRIILYLHGGGYVVGSTRTHRALVTTLGKAAGCGTLAIDYRLAPEHPFPAAVEDALAAYRWLLAKGFEPKRIAIAGDSAGGGLAVATLVNIRDHGLPLPAMGYCISPWIDLEGLGETMTTKALVDPLISKRQALLETAATYLAGTDPRHPLAAPLYADLTGLPPLFIQVGSAETLLDDSVRLAARAGAADVRVTLEIWPEMIHVFQAFTPLLPEAKLGLDRAGCVIAEALA